MELFHQIAEPESADIRRWLVEHGMTEKVRLRNIQFPEALADFKARGGTRTPALWDGDRLHVGRDACIQVLAKSD